MQSGYQWPDLTNHGAAWAQARKELGRGAPLRELLNRAEEIRQEKTHNAVPNDHRPHQRQA